MNDSPDSGNKRSRGRDWARQEAQRRQAAREARRASAAQEGAPDSGALSQTSEPTYSGRASVPGKQHARERAKKRHLQQAQIALLVAAIGIAIVGWQLSRPDSSTSASVCDISPLPAELAADASADGTATPLFACYRSLHFYLPVLPQELTEIAFHQASGDVAQHMDSLLPDADMTAAAQNRSTGRVLPASEESNTAPAILAGSVIRMWRSNRRGAPDTAVDVGASIGSVVRAPVTGRIAEVRAYKLYGEHDDYEIHIQPEGWPELDLVMIHVDEVVVQAGDHVIGGITPLAKIRLLSDRVTPQLGQYVPGTGDHVHMQLNAVEVPGRLSTVDGS